MTKEQILAMDYKPAWWGLGVMAWAALQGYAGMLGADIVEDPPEQPATVVIRHALDLCLECKACKSECPTNVDMARLKAEVLHQYFREHGVPWRNRLFGHVARLSRWGSRLAPLSNWIAQSQPAESHHGPPALSRQRCRFWSR